MKNQRKNLHKQKDQQWSQRPLAYNEHYAQQLNSFANCILCKVKKKQGLTKKVCRTDIKCKTCSIKFNRENPLCEPCFFEYHQKQYYFTQLKERNEQHFNNQRKIKRRRKLNKVYFGKQVKQKEMAIIQQQVNIQQNKLSSIKLEPNNLQQDDRISKLIYLVQQTLQLAEKLNRQKQTDILQQLLQFGAKNQKDKIGKLEECPEVNYITEHNIFNIKSLNQSYLIKRQEGQNNTQNECNQREEGRGLKAQNYVKMQGQGQKLIQIDLKVIKQQMGNFMKQEEIFTQRLK